LLLAVCYLPALIAVEGKQIARSKRQIAFY